MVMTHFLFVISIYFCSSYDMIPITNFEKKYFLLPEAQDSFVIFSYNHQGSENSIKYIHRIRRYLFSSKKVYQRLYVYDNISKINQSPSGDFKNYTWSSFFQQNDNYLEFYDEHNSSKTYYIVLYNYIKPDNDLNITLTIYSTETLTSLSNIVQAEISNEGSKDILIYKFQIPLNHKKYVFLKTQAIASDTKGDFLIYENGEILIHNNSLFDNNNYIELKKDSTYIIYLLIIQDSFYNRFYLFLAQTDYKKYFPVEIDTDYFENYPVFEDIYLLLNLSTVKSNKNMMIEFTPKYDIGEDDYYSYSLYSYNTEDANEIDNTEGEEIKFMEEELNYTGVYQRYIYKDSNDMKLIVFQIKYPNDQFSKHPYFNLRYGKQERHIPSTIYISFGIGIALSIPNIIFKIIIHCKKMKISTHIIFIMDIILHLAYSNIISRFIYLGRSASFWFGIGFAALYLLFAIYNILVICLKKQKQYLQDLNAY